MVKLRIMVRPDPSWGTTEPQPDLYEYPVGTAVTVKAIPAQGYIFLYAQAIWWRDDGSYVRGETFTVSSFTVLLDYNCTVEVWFDVAPPPPPPAPTDVVLVSYSWSLEEGTFPFTPQDVRRAFRLTYKVKNEGAAGRFDEKIYLNNAPSYITNPIYASYGRGIGAREMLTLSVVLPEPKGDEYYTLMLVSSKTRIYTLNFNEEQVGQEQEPDPARTVVVETTGSVSTPITQMVTKIAILLISVVSAALMAALAFKTLRGLA